MLGWLRGVLRRLAGPEVSAPKQSFGKVSVEFDEASWKRLQEFTRMPAGMGESEMVRQALILYDFYILSLEKGFRLEMVKGYEEDDDFEVMELPDDIFIPRK